MSEPLYDDQGRARPLRIELFESSGPTSPRSQYTTTVIVEAGPDTPPRWACDHRDATGTKHDELPLAREAYEALVAALFTALPLGAPLDLVGDKRTRKGISFNHVAITFGERTSRLDYLLSHVDEDDGDPRARAIVEALRPPPAR